MGHVYLIVELDCLYKLRNLKAKMKNKDKCPSVNFSLNVFLPFVKVGYLWGKPVIPHDVCGIAWMQTMKKFKKSMFCPVPCHQKLIYVFLPSHAMRIFVKQIGMKQLLKQIND